MCWQSFFFLLICWQVLTHNFWWEPCDGSRFFCWSVEGCLHITCDENHVMAALISVLTCYRGRRKVWKWSGGPSLLPLPWSVLQGSFSPCLVLHHFEQTYAWTVSFGLCFFFFFLLVGQQPCMFSCLLLWMHLLAQLWCIFWPMIHPLPLPKQMPC